MKMPEGCGSGYLWYEADFTTTYNPLFVRGDGYYHESDGSGRYHGFGIGCGDVYRNGDGIGIYCYSLILRLS